MKLTPEQKKLREFVYTVIQQLGECFSEASLNKLIEKKLPGAPPFEIDQELSRRDYKKMLIPSLNKWFYFRYNKCTCSLEDIDEGFVQLFLTEQVYSLPFDGMSEFLGSDAELLGVYCDKCSGFVSEDIVEIVGNEEYIQVLFSEDIDTISKALLDSDPILRKVAKTALVKVRRNADIEAATTNIQCYL